MTRSVPALVVLLACLLLAGAARAEKSRLGLSPEDQKKYDEEVKAAKEIHAGSTLLVQAGAGVFALGLLYAAFDTIRKASRKAAATGAGTGGAWAMAVVLILLAAGLVGAALFYIPKFGPLP